MLLHDALDERHAEPDAKRLGAEQRLEHALGHILRHAAAIVGHRQVDAVAQALGDETFMLGREPTVVDCGVWAQLVCCMHTTQPTPPRDAARGNPRLVAYVEAVAERAKLKIPSYG